MKKIIVMAALCSFPFCGYTEPKDVKFEKDNAILEMKTTKDGIEFLINSANEQSTCEVEGTATIIDDHRAAYTPKTNNDLCVILLDFKTESSVNVTTKDCSGYCGVQATGSMDGLYKK